MESSSSERPQAMLAKMDSTLPSISHAFARMALYSESVGSSRGRLAFHTFQDAKNSPYISWKARAVARSSSLRFSRKCHDADSRRPISHVARRSTTPGLSF